MGIRVVYTTREKEIKTKFFSVVFCSVSLCQSDLLFFIFLSLFRIFCFVFFSGLASTFITSKYKFSSISKYIFTSSTGRCAIKWLIKCSFIYGWITNVEFIE